MMLSRGTAATTERGQKSYTAILDAAARVFDEKGYHSSTVQDIADAAKLTKGGLYHHLSSKEQALYGINERILTSLLADMRAVTADHELSVATRIQRAVQLMAEQHDTLTPDLRVALLDFSSLTGEYRERILAIRDDLENIVKTLLIEGIDAGVIVRESPELLSKYVFGAINWMCIWYRESGVFSAHQIGELFSQITLRGISLSDGDSHGT